jgi:hypothetical protein
MKNARQTAGFQGAAEPKPEKSFCANLRERE